MNWLDEALANGTFVLDGAMGTMLFREGLRPGECGELWNVERSSAVMRVHQAYVAAGAMAITANTFGGSPLALARHELAQRARQFSAAGVELARRVAEGRAKVLGDLGPFGGFLEPVGETSLAELQDALTDQIQGFVDARADGVIVETMVDPAEVEMAVCQAKDMAEWPVLATFTFQKSADGTFRTVMGTTVAQAAEAAREADAVGANCGTGLSLDDYLELGAQWMAAAGGRPVLLQPNAGAPELVDGQIHYAAEPEDMAVWAAKAREIGVQIVGGCCGTTPDHIRAMAAA